jgi:hypothetical protein
MLVLQEAIALAWRRRPRAMAAGFPHSHATFDVVGARKPKRALLDEKR